MKSMADCQILFDVLADASVLYYSLKDKAYLLGEPEEKYQHVHPIKKISVKNGEVFPGTSLQILIFIFDARTCCLHSAKVRFNI